MSETAPIDLHDPLIVKVLWASMCSMVKDVHAPQDNLSKNEWEMAERLFIQLDALANAVHWISP